MLASAPLSSCSPLRNLGPLRRLSWQYKEDSMRWLVVIAAMLGCCGAAQAREPLARPMERTPSIMVDDRVQRPSKAKRQQKASPQASRTRQRQVNRTRSVVVPRLSNPYEAQTRSINSSIGSQLQQSQSDQNRQVDNNLFRQEIQRSTSSPPPGCVPGSLGC